MCLRISSALSLAIALSGCGAETSPPPPGDTVDCAIGAGAAFSPVCTLERVGGIETFVIHHPDGGFRRFVIDPASGMPTPRDGADQLVAEQGENGALQFAVGADRYRIPPAQLSAAPE